MNDDGMGILHVVSDEEWHIEDGETPALLLAAQLFMSPIAGRTPMPAGMYPIWTEDDGNLGIGSKMRVITYQVTINPQRPEDAISEATRWVRYFLFGAVLTAAVVGAWVVFS